jgi:hypothetical protein
MAYYMFLPLIFASGFQEADSELEDDPFYRVLPVTVQFPIFSLAMGAGLCGALRRRS